MYRSCAVTAKTHGSALEGGGQLAGQELQQALQVDGQLEHEAAAALRLRICGPLRRHRVVHLLRKRSNGTSVAQQQTSAARYQPAFDHRSQGTSAAAAQAALAATNTAVQRIVTFDADIVQACWLGASQHASTMVHMNMKSNMELDTGLNVELNIGLNTELHIVLNTETDDGAP